MTTSFMSGRAYSELRGALLGGKLLPHQRLVEKDLVDTLGVNRAAVREALARLEQEGLVERRVNRGVTVRDISPQEAHDVMEMRIAIESLAVCWACGRRTPEQFAQLRHLLDNLQEFAKRGDVFRAIDGLNFSVRKGERIAIVGETGSGKSTALSLLLGLTKPTSGSVSVLDTDPFAHFNDLAGRIGIIFQSARLLDWRTSLDNAAFGLQTLGMDKRARHTIAAEWLVRLGLKDFMHAYPHELSGGMKQRVAIARTMAISPEVLVADEAFSALDEMTAASVRSDLLTLVVEEQVTTIFVTHSVSESVSLADRVLVFTRPGHVQSVVHVSDLRSEGRDDLAIQDLVRAGLRDSGAGERHRADGAPNV